MANHLLKKIKFITSKRITNSLFLERNLKEIKQLIFKDRQKNLKEVFHLYEFRVKNFKLRDKLVNFLKSKGIDAKIHYPIPMHYTTKVYNIKKGSYNNRKNREIYNYYLCMNTLN